MKKKREKGIIARQGAGRILFSVFKEHILGNYGR
jgi:hypothetical protein